MRSALETVLARNLRHAASSAQGVVQSARAFFDPAALYKPTYTLALLAEEKVQVAD